MVKLSTLRNYKNKKLNKSQDQNTEILDDPTKIFKSSSYLSDEKFYIKIKSIMSNYVFLCLCFGLTGLFYIITGI